MDERSALLRAIIDSPDEDGPRLVYADWLEEHGEAARAEFIRVQIEVARMGEDESRRNQLKTREYELWRDYQGQWDWEVPEIAAYRVEYRRGFIEKVSLPAVELIRCPGSVWHHTPLVGLGLPDLTPEIGARLGEWPHWNRITELDLTGVELTPEAARALALIPGLSSLKVLTLQPRYGVRQLIGDAVVLALAASPSYLTQLTKLDLRNNEVGVEGARALAHSPNFDRLEELDLSFNPLGLTGKLLLLASPRLPNLRFLGIEYRQMEESSAEEVAELLRQVRQLGPENLPASAGIKVLSLGHGANGIFLGDAGAELLAALPRLADLISLDLFDTDIGDRGALALAESPFLQRLSYLNLSDNPISAETISVLRARFGNALVFE